MNGVTYDGYRERNGKLSTYSSARPVQLPYSLGMTRASCRMGVLHVTEFESVLFNNIRKSHKKVSAIIL